MPGVWAAGNATNPRAQVITAAGEGSAVAIAINTQLLQDDVDTAGASRRALRLKIRGRPMTDERPTPPAPPTRHGLAIMIWLCVFPTLTALNVTLGDWLAPMSPVVRTFVLATIAVPIVMYGLMPHLHRVRVASALVPTLNDGQPSCGGSDFSTLDRVSSPSACGVKDFLRMAKLFSPSAEALSEASTHVSTAPRNAKRPAFAGRFEVPPRGFEPRFPP